MKRVTNTCLPNKFVTSHTAGNSSNLLSMKFEGQWDSGGLVSWEEQVCGFCHQQCRISLCREVFVGWTLLFCLLCQLNLQELTVLATLPVKFVQNYLTSLPLPEFPRVEITLPEVASMKLIISIILKLSCKN